MAAQSKASSKQSPVSWFFSFPNPVNEASARLVAGMVVALAVSFVVTGQLWILAFMAYGFLAHVLSGPKFSPIGLLATKVIVPRTGWYKPVAGPPKRFAQAIGLAFSITALVLLLALDSAIPAKAVIGVLAGFAFLESGLAFCAGCFVFNQLMRVGLIPESICRECADIVFNRTDTQAANV
ncbi:MAG: DUF4395 domain-containing protein [SAR202 cluster bacterium]|nr:DUF4395 domain-containing protein [SAR202 cluster bacterium]